MREKYHNCEIEQEKFFTMLQKSEKQVKGCVGCLI